MMGYLKTYQGPFRWINSDLLRLDKKTLQTNCPNCGAPVCRNMLKCEYCGTDKMEDAQMNTKLSYTPEELKSLWLDFGNVPINDDDEILEPFLAFEAGTDRFMIWTWFDLRYPGGVYTLINDTGKED